MATINLVAEISELRTKGDEKRVIRISMDHVHVFTRTLVLRSGFSSQIDRVRDGFKAADDQGITLEHSMKCAIRDFADSFGTSGGFFRSHAPRRKRLFVTLSRPSRPQRYRHRPHSNSGDAAAAGLLVGSLVGLVVGVALSD
jgi:hypothetical protein